MLTLQKIWLYAGWFYLSLFLAIIFELIFKKRFRRLVLNLSLSFALLISAYFFLKNFKETPHYWNDFRLPVEQKINKTSFSQAHFGEELKKILPQDARGCILWSWDTPTRFLIQRIYPHIFIPVRQDDSIEKCEFLISQFKSTNIFGFKLIFSSEQGYLYKKE